MNPWFDVIVVGGGPAGSAVAIGLARAGHSVAVLEQSHYDRVRIGETLPPAARLPLAELGIWGCVSAEGHLPSAGTLAAWGQTDPHENHFIFNPYGHGWHVDRRRFDAMLAQSAEAAGARIYRGARAAGCDPTTHGWQVTFTHGCRHETIHAAFVVDASGRSAFIARRLGARRASGDRLVGVAGFLSAAAGAQTRDTRTLVEAAEDGWWYSAWLPGDRLVVAYMTDADLLPKGSARLRAFWHERLAQAIYTHERGRGCTIETIRAYPAGSHRLDQPAGSNWLAIGDAAMAFDPLSSRGISSALESGGRAAHAISGCLCGDSGSVQDYARWLERSYDDYLHRRTVFYRRETRWPTSTFWWRRHRIWDAAVIH